MILEISSDSGILLHDIPCSWALPVISAPPIPHSATHRISSALRLIHLFAQAKLARSLSAEERNVALQAFAGLMWTKQFYHYITDDWLEGDPEQPRPPEQRKGFRNADWRHLFNRDVISVCDKWEYPW